MGYNPKVIILDPSDISDILDNIYEISKSVGKIKKGQNLVKSLENKINKIKINYINISIKKQEHYFKFYIYL